MAVDHSHIVPASYLRQWSDDDGFVQMVLVADGFTKPIGVRDAGVRGGGFYKRERPDGERSDDIETVSIQDIENKAAPILQDLESRWPLPGADKLALSMLVALQLVRGPKFFNWHDEFAATNMAQYREEGRFVPPPESDASEEATYHATLEHVTGSTSRLVAMLRLTAKIASCFGSMTWGLVGFDSPVLATSDHPVVVWPASEAGRPVEPAVAQQIGIGNVFEARVPVSPQAAILMAWRDRRDPAELIAGRTHHADNLNAFTIVEAEKQWFHKPGARRPRERAGPWLPLAPELLPGYTLFEAAQCRRRQEIIGAMNGRLGEEMDQSLRAEIRHIPTEREASLAA